MSYRAAIADLPRPSSVQVDAFVEHVFGAHSWYKSLMSGGAENRFGFFLDPSAGWATRQRADGSVERSERREGDRLAHYSDLPTAVYLQRFGHLAYAFEPMSHHEPVSAPGSRPGARSWSDQRAYVLTPEHGVVPVPAEVLEVGTIELNGAIHPITDSTYVWCGAWARLARRPWPEESGGAAAIARLREVVERATADAQARRSTAPVVFAQTWEGRARNPFDLHEIVAPERERQRREAIATIGRMLDHLFGGR